jgi:hypothetical protein
MPRPLRCAVNGLAWGWNAGASDQQRGDRRSTAYGAWIGNDFAADFSQRYRVWVATAAQHPT